MTAAALRAEDRRLLHLAADLIASNAADRKQKHALPCGSWLINGPADMRAFQQNERELAVAHQLRALAGPLLQAVKE